MWFCEFKITDTDNKKMNLLLEKGNHNITTPSSL
ncbi:hypothetical protein V12B01_20143 [Vibrio splendidus 12B01]|nr:hypothetical protein V12B01_20143 [Vibrio splendidus 12B01]